MAGREPVNLLNVNSVNIFWRIFIIEIWNIFYGIRTFPSRQLFPRQLTLTYYLSGQLTSGLLPPGELSLKNFPLDNYIQDNCTLWNSPSDNYLLENYPWIVPPGQISLNNCPPLWNAPTEIASWTFAPPTFLPE